LRQSNTEETKVRYVLGTLSDEEKDRLEESYFVDDTEFEEFEIAEEELIDRYVRGELSKQESDQLEKAFARTPRLIQRVQIARVLANRLAPAPATVAAAETRQPQPVRTSWWPTLLGSGGSRAPAMAFGFSVLLLLLGGATLFAAYLSLREQSRQLVAQQAAIEQRQRELDKQAADLKAQTDQLTRQVQSPSETPTPPQVAPTPQAAPSVAFLALSAGITRSGGGSKSVRVGPEISEVELKLDLRDTSYPSYRATVFNADRGEVFSRSGLRPQATRLTLRVPAKQLPAGDYYVSIYGGPANESVADYAFRVTK